VIKTTILVSLILIAAMAILSRARGHDGYEGLINPGTHKSCCSDADCRRGSVWRNENGDLTARVNGKDRHVPESALVPDNMNPHPPMGMICERYGIFFCVARSGAGS
jgi:hypothetical protein